MGHPPSRLRADHRTVVEVTRARSTVRGCCETYAEGSDCDCLRIAEEAEQARHSANCSSGPADYQRPPEADLYADFCDHLLAGQLFERARLAFDHGDLKLMNALTHAGQSLHRSITETGCEVTLRPCVSDADRYDPTPNGG